jgi:hypothetical protein
VPPAITLPYLQPFDTALALLDRAIVCEPLYC